jgi:hypothetical protein
MVVSYLLLEAVLEVGVGVGVALEEEFLVAISTNSKISSTFCLNPTQTALKMKNAWSQWDINLKN